MVFIEIKPTCIFNASGHPQYVDMHHNLALDKKNYFLNPVFLLILNKREMSYHGYQILLCEFKKYHQYNVVQKMIASSTKNQDWLSYFIGLGLIRLAPYNLETLTVSLWEDNFAGGLAEGITVIILWTLIFHHKVCIRSIFFGD